MLSLFQSVGSKSTVRTFTTVRSRETRITRTSVVVNTIDTTAVHTQVGFAIVDIYSKCVTITQPKLL